MIENSLSELEISIINLFKKNKKSISLNQIRNSLNIKGSDSLNELKKTLKNLEINKKIYANEHDEYQLFDKCNNINVGIVKLNKKQ